MNLVLAFIYLNNILIYQTDKDLAIKTYNKYKRFYNPIAIDAINVSFKKVCQNKIIILLLDIKYKK